MIGRLLYLHSYRRDPQKRLLGAAASGHTHLALLVLAIAGLVRAWRGA